MTSFQLPFKLNRNITKTTTYEFTLSQGP